MTLSDFLAQCGGFEHLDPRPHAHYPVRQFGRTLHGHRHDCRAVAAPRETLAAMNRPRTDIGLRLFAVNFQFHVSLGTVDDSKGPFGMRGRIEVTRKDKSHQRAIGLMNEFDRPDSLHRKINDRAAPMAVAEQIKTAAIGNQRVWVEVMLPPLASQTGVVDPEPALVEQRAQNYVELLAERTIVLGGVWDGVKLALEIGEPRLLRKAQVLINFLPQPLDPLLQHRALEELEHGHREIQQRDLVRRRLRGL